MDMVTINQVLTLLDNNKSIDTAVKDNMRELIILFNEKFANVSLNNLARILPNLSIIKSNKFVNRRIFKYNIKGDLMESYDSQVNAELANKYSNITKSIKLKQACRNGYFWSLQKLPKLSWKDRRWVQRYDLDGNYIRGWKYKKQCYREVDDSVWKSFNTGEPYTDGFIYMYD